jgi:hypothetical protein
VHFLDELRGWGVGSNMSIYQTGNGGRSWSRLPVSDEPQTDRRSTEYHWLDFADAKRGIIVGHHASGQPPRLLPPPGMASGETGMDREPPGTVILVQTNDGGMNWTSTIIPIVGRLTRLRLLPGGGGLALVRFQYSLEWPSEVFRLDPVEEANVRSFRENNRSITDVFLTEDRTAYLAGFEPLGSLLNSPIPGRLVVLRSRNLTDWEEMEVDYRAVARQTTFAAAGQRLWVATDTGMILELVEP